MMNPFSKEYIPKPKNSTVGNHKINQLTRERFFSGDEPNLEFLIRERYEWMKNHIDKDKKILELGSGAGLIKEVLKGFDIITSDVEKTPYIDTVIDATLIKEWIGEYDIIICSQMIHHLTSPINFLYNLNCMLKPGSLILINESNPSFIHRCIMILFQHEGWSYNVNPFDSSTSVKTGLKPMDGNNAVSRMIFDKPDKLLSICPLLDIVEDSFCESFLFIISGGVGKKTFTIQLPYLILKTISLFDIMISTLFPSIFPLSRKIVIKKRLE